MDGNYQHKYVTTVAPPYDPNTAIGVPAVRHATHRVDIPWSTKLCDCCHDVTNCCITCWCPCITFGQIAEIIDQGSTSCAINGILYGLLVFFTGCGCCFSCCYRSKLRRLYHLEDDACGDLCVHCWCESCALCQEYRELKNRGFNMPIGWKENQARMTQGQGVQMAPTAVLLMAPTVGLQMAPTAPPIEMKR